MLRPCRLAVALLLIPFPSDRLRAQDGPPPELRGRWFVAAVEESGRAVQRPDWVHTSWRFDGNKAAVGIRGMGGRPDDVAYFAFSASPAADPPRLTLYTDNPRVGFTCVYKVERDAAGVETLVVCYNPGGQAVRPPGFRTTRDDTFTLVRFRRQP